MIGIRQGLRQGSRQGSRQGTARDPLGSNPPTIPPAGFSSDAISGKAVPNSSAEWTAFLASIGSTLSAPQHLWLMQEASGAPADSIGARNLTVANAPSYRKAISGWSRTAIGGAGVASNVSLSNTAMVDTSTTSYLVLAYVRFDTPPASLHALAVYGTPAVQLPAATHGLRLREGASITDSAGAHDVTVHPLLLAFNVAATTVRLYTDLEKLSVTYATSSGASLSLTLATASDTTATDLLYACAWDGAAAETTDAAAKVLIAGLGYSPSWT